jgi:zinc protease
MKHILNLIGLLLLFIFPYTRAQESYPLPLDTAVRYGRLENGLTYYIRHNEQPKERAEFFIAQNVGAILENDDQDGLAHFLEHMAFNGTSHFPGKSLIEYFESIGVKFGTNINAYTSLDETVYNLSAIPTTREGIIDSALLALYDWSHCISLENDEIDKERGVIREEWRQGQNADRRIWKEANKRLFAGSPYAKRDVIGDTSVINHFSHTALKNYYKKWYRPDLQAILIVGDIDVDQIEQKIKALFTTIPAPINPSKRIYFPIPDPDKPVTGVFTDPEEQGVSVHLYYMFNPLPDSIQLSQEGYVTNLIKTLINYMTSERFSAVAMEPETPFASLYSALTSITRTKEVYAFIAEPVTGKDSAARARLLQEVEKIHRYGFTVSELERAKTALSSRIEQSYNERSKRPNKALVQEYVRHFTQAEPAPGIEWEYRFSSQVLPEITVEMVNQIANELLKSPSMAYLILGPQKDGLVYPSDSVLRTELQAVPSLTLEPPKEELSDQPLISVQLKPGKIKEQRYKKC